MRLWIDVVNSPHVRLFRRLIRKHRSEISYLLVTYRSYESLEKLAMNMLSDMVDDLILVGVREVDRKKKLESFLNRVKGLMRAVSDRHIDVALSKASPELARTAFGLGTPAVTVNDNEHSVPVIKLTFPLSKAVVVPKVFPENIKERFCTGTVKEFRFDGLCEVAHVADFLENCKRIPHPDEDYLVARPEPIGASYMGGIRASRFVHFLEEIVARAGLRLYYFPRQNDPWVAVLSKKFKDLVILSGTDALPILAGARAFVGGGGTMTREAALLGTPAIHLYPGDRLAVDKLLEERGLIINPKNVDEAVEFIEMRNELRSRARELLSQCQDPTEVIWRAVVWTTESS